MKNTKKHTTASLVKEKGTIFTVCYLNKEHSRSANLHPTLPVNAVMYSTASSSCGTLPTQWSMATSPYEMGLPATASYPGGIGSCSRRGNRTLSGIPPLLVAAEAKSAAAILNPRDCRQPWRQKRTFLQAVETAVSPTLRLSPAAVPPLQYPVVGGPHSYILQSASLKTPSRQGYRVRPRLKPTQLTSTSPLTYRSTTSPYSFTSATHYSRPGYAASFISRGSCAGMAPFLTLTS